MTDMEANNKIKKRKTKSSSKSKNKEKADSLSSSSSSKKKKADISFVLERSGNRSNGSIFGDYPSSGGSIGMMGGGYQYRNTNNDYAQKMGAFGLGMFMLICCVSSQVMIDQTGSGTAGLHDHSGALIHHHARNLNIAPE